MPAVLDSLRERRCSKATVWSFAANERANAFYEAHVSRATGRSATEEVWADLLEVRCRRSL